MDMVGVSDTISDAGREIRQSIDAAKAAAAYLIERGDAAAKARLEQIDQIQKNAFANANALLAESEEAALRVLKEAASEISTLEKQIFADLNATIWNVECGARRLVGQDLSEALGGFGDMLGTHQIRISTPVPREPEWYCSFMPFCRVGDPVFEIKEPFGDTYIAIRDFMIGSVGTISQDGAAHTIVGTYEYLSTLAKRTSCYYEGASDIYIHEFIKYRDMARAWRAVLNIEVAK